MKYLNKLLNFSSQQTPGNCNNINQTNDHNNLFSLNSNNINQPANQETITFKANYPSYTVAFQQNSYKFSGTNNENRFCNQELEDDHQDKVGLDIDEASSTHSNHLNHSLLSPTERLQNSGDRAGWCKEYQEQSLGLFKYLLTTTRGAYNRNKFIRSHSGGQPRTISPDENLDYSRVDLRDADDQCKIEPNDIDDDWIIVDKKEIDHRDNTKLEENLNHPQRDTKTNKARKMTSNHVMAPAQESKLPLVANDIKLIKDSWVSVDRDHVTSGILLFKGLFTRFPEYLKFFPQFSDLDLDNMHENKRLLRHAVKVIETVTFVVNAVGDESLSSQLAEALTGLVRGHLKRNIGKVQFSNLKVVLIDFICEINQRRGVLDSQTCNPDSSPKNQCQLNNSSNNDSIAINSSIDSDTMTSALDKVRASTSPSSSSDDDSYLIGDNNNTLSSADGDSRKIDADTTISGRTQELASEGFVTKFNTIDILATKVAWEKLYSIIMDAVERESQRH